MSLKKNTHVVVGRGLPVLGEGLRRQLHLDERELGLHPLGVGSPLGVHHQPLPIPPEPCAAAATRLQHLRKEGNATDGASRAQRPRTSGGDGGLGHGDAPAGLDGVYQDGLHRRRRLPIAAAAEEEGGEEGGGLLHGHSLSPAPVGWKKEDGTVGYHVSNKHSNSCD